jgi:hypothetical protein
MGGAGGMRQTREWWRTQAQKQIQVGKCEYGSEWVWLVGTHTDGRKKTGVGHGCSANSEAGEKTCSVACDGERGLVEALIATVVFPF